MLLGLFLIITAWVVPGLPLWYSIVTTILGSLHLLFRICEYSDAAADVRNSKNNGGRGLLS